MAIRALVVGGTNGIGYGIACRLAAEASTSAVIISGRTKPQNIAHANIEFRQLDASSMRRIKQYTDTFKAEVPPAQKLDYLVMTQGIMTTAGRNETPEGIDHKMALHYYGKQLLIRELMPVLKDDAKVIIVLDAVMGNPAKLDWDDLDLKKHFGLASAGNHCMVMNDAMVQYYAAKQKQQQQGTEGVTKRHFIHAWPGIVKSNIPSALPWYLRPLLQATMAVAGSPPETFAQKLLTGVSETTATTEKEGQYWININQKGRLVEKKLVWSEEQMTKIADHTWSLVDKAIATEGPSTKL